MSMIVPIILAGGSGSRLWPLSREQYPKQLLALVGKHSLLQETIKRAQQIPMTQEPIVICNQQYRFLISEQMNAIGIHEPKLILEPHGKNTAPAIAIAAHIVNKLYPEARPLLLILPADHVIEETNIFIERIRTTLPFVEQGYLSTFGITPTYPETGYGYIKAGKMLGTSVYTIERFVEKPPREQAESYLADGAYYWNSGMFLFAAEAYLTELKKHSPKIAKSCTETAKKITELGGYYLLSETFSECPSDSIDYAVMEKTDKALVTPLPVKWSDVGSWSALWDINTADDQGNIIQGDVTTIDTENCYLRSESRLIATAGLKDHLVVETSDAIMVAHKDYAQKVKDLFHELKAKARNEVIHHEVVHRPWGTYEVLTEGPYYRVKHVFIKPGASLSSQAHKHRSEHWVVLKGTLTLRLDDHKIQKFEAYGSAFIKPQQTHQLSNEGKTMLEIIEVQAGDYLSEDDIYHEEH
jgi:mannose-1-phosphate guanylyltransferase/mannose-6-phosphate isomerase